MLGEYVIRTLSIVKSYEFNPTRAYSANHVSGCTIYNYLQFSKGSILKSFCFKKIKLRCL